MDPYTDSYGGNSPEYEASIMFPTDVEEPYIENIDYENLLMSLSINEAKIVIVRVLGFEGKEAAKLAGFNSQWIYYKAMQSLKRTLKSKRSDIFC